jgi:hypothetical protein
VIGGSLSYTRKLGPETSVNIYAERLSIAGPSNSRDTEAILRNLAVYEGARHENLTVRAGYERGSFQASVQAERQKKLARIGAEARVSVAPDGCWSVFVGAQGRF